MQPSSVVFIKTLDFIGDAKKGRFYSLEMFKFSSKDGSSSGEDDSVPLLDDVNAV